MISGAEARAIALSLPGATEQDHHGRASFRVGGKIFATVPSPDRLNVMLDEPGIRAAVNASPESCDFVHWGAKLSAVGVDLAAVDAERLRALLTAAHARRATGR